jgi:hypothetical protein
MRTSTLNENLRIVIRKEAEQLFVCGGFPEDAANKEIPSRNVPEAHGNQQLRKASV